MSNQPTHSHHFATFRRLWKPTVVAGASGTAVAIWFNEIIMFGQEILTLIFLSIIAGVIYLFNIFIFKFHKPRREDMKNSNARGAKK